MSREWAVRKSCLNRCLKLSFRGVVLGRMIRTSWVEKWTKSTNSRKYNRRYAILIFFYSNNKNEYSHGLVTTHRIKNADWSIKIHILNKMWKWSFVLIHKGWNISWGWTIHKNVNCLDYNLRHGDLLEILAGKFQEKRKKAMFNKF